MKLYRAFLAGICGAIAMSLAMFLLRLLGINVNLEALLGSLIEAPAGMAQSIAGFAIHLIVGACAGFAYAVVFEWAIQRSGAVAGAGLGLCHGLLAGLMMSGIPAMNPLSVWSHSAPGPFLMNIQLGPFLFVLLHVLFGAVTGVAYGPTVQHEHTIPDVSSGQHSRL